MQNIQVWMDSSSWMVFYPKKLKVQDVCDRNSNLNYDKQMHTMLLENTSSFLHDSVTQRWSRVLKQRAKLDDNIVSSSLQ